ncbi:hypothetical protein INR49_021439 [Caranx melampygus]|nr:hypothetical protein INR49_021439 [Caranx melampygus]
MNRIHKCWCRPDAGSLSSPPSQPPRLHKPMDIPQTKCSRSSEYSITVYCRSESSVLSSLSSSP